MEETLKDKLLRLCDETKKSRDELIKATKFFQENIEYLQVCVKYLQFDLEATRRERDQLKKMLDEKNGQ